MLFSKKGFSYRALVCEKVATCNITDVSYHVTTCHAKKKLTRGKGGSRTQAKTRPPLPKLIHVYTRYAMRCYRRAMEDYNEAAVVEKSGGIEDIDLVDGSFPST